MATVSLRDEVTELLQELIRIDTTNPPGNETAAAEVLRAYLEDSGAEVELYARIPERANLVARIPGRGDGPALLFLSHTDVVLADAAEWTADPFGGELRSGEIWGRGALDMKGQVAASAVAIASLAREGFEPAGDLIFAATADEEVGAGFGAQWLCETHPDAVRCDYLINEGSGERLELGGKPFYMCSVAEKMSAPFRLRVRGRSGHASMPGIADNALVKAAPLITALGEYVPEQRLTPEVEALLEAVTGDRPASPAEALERAREIGEFFAEMVEPLLSLTLAPTMITASQKRNVIPAVCDVVVDSRLLPETAPAEQHAIVRSVLGDGDYELDELEAHGGTRSPIESPLWDAVADWVSEVEPGARPAPICVAGFTDSHWFREAFGTVAYGFFPSRAMPAELAARLIHSADERIPVEDLELGVSFMRHAAQAMLT
ncbi:MAG TPA: M20/M25/M40 family metallo-hydrolase [Gaiellaceae bacterium]|jgi:acetylornithine deacetylase/succinyl-diaminopimelate desuccinylase-like protein|nr:M20/M25/M40 family metallo-hydrolase [Gaiellaceae bacterium]